MNRRKYLATLGVLGSGTAAAMGTGAFTSASATRDVTVTVADDTNGYLGFSASTSENGEFASVDTGGDGEIALDFGVSDGGGSGVGLNSTYNFDDVFQLENQGTQTIYVWANFSGDTLDDDDIWFYPDGESGRKLNDGMNSVVTVPVGETIKMGVHIDTNVLDSTENETLTTTLTADVDVPSGSTPSDGVGEDAAVVSKDPDDGEYDTIQGAINEVDGTTVYVEPGTYEESVTIDVDGLTLEGAGADSSTIVGQDSLTVTSTAPNVEIAGFRIENPEGSRAVRVTDDATNAVIRDNTVTNVNTENDANQPRGIVVGGLDDGDSADGLEIKNNTVTNIEGADPDEDQAHAIQILEESNGGGLIENVTVGGNTIDDILDTRSTVAVNFNGNIEGEITNNNISGLNTEGTTDSGDPGGFTQVIALNAGGNASSGPQNVDVSANKISNIETTTEENFAPPFHIIIGGDADGGTISIDSNEFNADSPDTDVYLNDGTGSVDLENVISNNNFDTEPVLIDLNDDEEHETIVPPNFE